MVVYFVWLFIFIVTYKCSKHHTFIRVGGNIKSRNAFVFRLENFISICMLGRVHVISVENSKDQYITWFYNLENYRYE